ncbi:MULTISPECIES: acyl-CoA dehydrogenase family protein [unclassified Sulfitobacter]|jgi:alkylation response protein AidB-like acyl-CoA dehydrogenase|uniref:acyl-CoA dehydrogenase family protein n=1 Tax=unclassified Sulfitobacter TaxID=196795 RepID=UPI0007C3BDF7|nr:MULTISPECIES: acyl-CoA dehydrogenase family protein [unclassified Sulfitobacter]KZY06269.1 acyl-CoA dehydrogenase [Sulfitobacter sp. HI0023]KZY27373.1 acyl-CoA dehydrogenase [Sulfitobacter sp. HI0040]
MDFSDSPEEAAFRAKARDWLDANATRRNGSEKAQDHFMARDADEVARARNWQARKADAGWAGLTWPRAFGGRDANPIEQVIWNQEEGRYAVPPNVFLIGIGLVGPTIMIHGTEDQKTKFLARALTGEEIWCQLFSEPAAGSDLAGIRTRARREGDEWVISGQKVWTSGAHYSTHGILLARTDPQVPKHKGMTMFFVDMSDPAIETRPIRQISGNSSFNEVFIDDLRVPDSARLGGVSEGWKVALTTLMNERFSISVGRASGGARAEELIDLATRVERNGRPAIEDGEVRARIADFIARQRGLEFTSYRVMTSLSRGQAPGEEGSIGKLLLGKLRQEMGAFGMDLAGTSAGISAKAGDDMARWRNEYLTAPGNRIAGGSDEIQRTIIGERILGLPPEVRVDKDVAFSEL